jgi:hypothetical protein
VPVLCVYAAQKFPPVQEPCLCGVWGFGFVSIRARILFTHDVQSRQAVDSGVLGHVKHGLHCSIMSWQQNLSWQDHDCTSGCKAADDNTALVFKCAYCIEQERCLCFEQSSSLLRQSYCHTSCSEQLTDAAIPACKHCSLQHANTAPCTMQTLLHEASNHRSMQPHAP